MEPSDELLTGKRRRRRERHYIHYWTGKHKHLLLGGLPGDDRLSFW
jgi:hypothetical protein